MKVTATDARDSPTLRYASASDFAPAQVLSSRAMPAALILLVAIAAFVSIGPALDDAYIVYRYVVRFVGGQGLTFNDGEYVEGFTSLVWTLSLALTAWISGLEVHVASVVLNYFAIVCTTLAMTRLLRVLDVPRPMNAVAIALMATSALYFRVVYIGLELGLYSLLLVCFFWALFSGDRNSARSPRALIVPGVLAGMLAGTRPESVVVAPLVCLVLLVWGRQQERSRAAGWLCGGWAVVTGAILLWQLSTYGEWLPNSVIAKAIDGNSLRDHWLLLRRGGRYVLDAYVQTPVLALMLLVATVGSVRLRARRLQLTVLCVPLAIGHAAVVQNGGDWMPYFRFIGVLTPIYVAAFCMVTGEWQRRNPSGAAALIVVVAVVQLASQAQFVEVSLRPRIGSFDGWMDLYRQAGTALRGVWVDRDVLAAESIGMIGYAAPEMYLHDPLGLTDRHLAHDPAARRSIYGRSNWQYSVGLDPALILLHHWPHQRTWSAFAPAYPASYDFYAIPWTGAEPRRCLYAIVRKNRADAYGPTLRQLHGRVVPYDQVRYPCEAAQ